MKIEKETLITFTASQLMQLLNHEWKSGAQNCPGFSTASIFESEENAESFRTYLLQIGAMADGMFASRFIEKSAEKVVEWSLKTPFTKDEREEIKRLTEYLRTYNKIHKDPVVQDFLTTANHCLKRTREEEM